MIEHTPVTRTTSKTTDQQDSEGEKGRRKEARIIRPEERCRGEWVECGVMRLHEAEVNYNQQFQSCTSLSHRSVVP